MCEQLDVDRMRRAMRVGGKALAGDAVQNSLWPRAPGWVFGLLVECYREVADTKVVPASWKRFILVLLNKKKMSDLVHKKREVACMSHGAKLMERAGVQQAIDEVTCRGLAVQFGFQAGTGSADVALGTTLVMGMCMMLGVDLVLVFTDMETFFPRCQHAVLDVSALYAGVPSDVRELTRALYEGACAQYG